MEWVNTIVKRRLELGQPIDNMTCEICKETLDLEKKTRFVCRSKPEIQKRIKEYWVFFTVCASMFLFSLAAIGVIAYIQAVKVNQTASDGLKSGIAAAWAILVILALFWLGRIIWNYVIGQEVYISKVIPKTDQVLQTQQKVVQRVPVNVQSNGAQRQRHSVIEEESRRIQQLRINNNQSA